MHIHIHISFNSYKKSNVNVIIFYLRKPEKDFMQNHTNISIFVHIEILVKIVKLNIILFYIESLLLHPNF